MAITGTEVGYGERNTLPVGVAERDSVEGAGPTEVSSRNNS